MDKHENVSNDGQQRQISESSSKAEGSLRRLFSLLDLDLPELGRVAQEVLHDRLDNACQALKEHLLERLPPLFCSDKESAADIAAYVRRHQPEETALVMDTSEEVLRQTFHFRFPTDMERSSVPVTFAGEIDWNHVPDRDEEWAYMLNRHRYWGALGQAYLLTGEERFAEGFCLQLDDWLRRNPVPAEVTRDTMSWRSIEAGMRMSHWLKALAYTLRSPAMTPLLTARMLLSFHEHADYLERAFSRLKIISNWGVLENGGLFQIASVLPEFRRSEHWAETARQRLEETARVQIMKDGVHWEQSFSYHLEVMSMYHEVLMRADRQGMRLNADFTATVREMAYASMHLAKPDHRQVLLGDSDNSDIRSALTAAAWLHREPLLKSGAHSEMDYDNAWLFGISAIQEYSRMRAELPARLSHAFPHSGHYVMRSGWKEEDLFLYFRCGPLGGGHGHADLLHIDVHAYGRELLTDSGRYTYSDGKPERRELKQAEAHNTTLVDGRPFTEIMDTWTTGRAASPTGVSWISESAYDYAEGSHTGYRLEKEPVYPKRRILFIKPFFWLLTDAFDGRGEHEHEQYFHFAPGAARLSEESGVCLADGHGGARLAILPVEPGAMRFRLQEGKVSKVYNEIEPRATAVYSRKGPAPSAMMQVLLPLPSSGSALPVVEKMPVRLLSGELAGDDRAAACRIEMTDSGESHIILIAHEPPAQAGDCYVVDGIQVFGEVVWIHRRGGEAKATVVK
ncbi:MULTISPECIES: alginate lyase family protein [unclassified Paenibacillus]|uniref:alginate lyase family protein n=1 Tax=unclassified Paenibacillus TaxID=185978 RepID=UPI000955B586|nr:MULTISPECIES: alginate lyase family protein [unclassified Paenibacillus]ASS66067.1 heparinase [Paenibacillus sp. RUD330]SIQ13575.1 Heparinase II/III-like protein [Paenibacillus sp. RU4X]SIQ35395.1 Heparinase II/III-like protein [Paenibacillus sp. RU4T]